MVGNLDNKWTTGPSEVERDPSRASLLPAPRRRKRRSRRDDAYRDAVIRPFGQFGLGHGVITGRQAGRQTE